MTVIYVEGQEPSDGTTLRQGKNGVLIREESRRYIVVTDNAFVDKLDVLGCPDLPSFGEIVGGMAIKSMNATRSPDSQFRWMVTIELSSEVDENQKEQNPDSPSSDPTTWVPIASVVFEPYLETVRRSVDGKLICNSAGETPSTSLEVTKRIACVNFSQFEPITTKLDELMERSDTVNSTNYKTRDKGTLLLAIERATIVRINGFRCWRVDYVMKFKRDTWVKALLDEGFTFYSGGKKLQFFREQWEGTAYDSKPIGQTPFEGLLDGAGGAIADQKRAATEGTEAYRFFKIFYEKDFNAFLRVLFTTA